MFFGFILKNIFIIVLDMIMMYSYHHINNLLEPVREYFNNNKQAKNLALKL